MPVRLTNLLFQTQPIVVHCPGGLSRGWSELETAVLAAPARQCRLDSLTILTWNSGAPRLGRFERSLARLSISPLVLGNGVDNWQNILKLRLTAEALRNVETPLVMGADSGDVLMLDDHSILVERFEASFDCDLVFNSTGGECWPKLTEFTDFESALPTASAAQGRHWLNSGVWIGRTDFCRQFFSELAEAAPIEDFEWSDQAVVKRAWPRWFPRVQIDYFSQLFQWFNEDHSLLQVEGCPDWK